MDIKILPKQGSRDKFLIIIDDEPWKEIHTSIFGKKPYLPNFESLSSLNEITLQFIDLEYKLAKIYALRCLGRKSYPEAELTKKLEQRLVSSQNIRQIVQDLQRLGYLNDSIWIEAFVRQASRRYGPKAIALKLRAKGLSRERIEEALGCLRDNYSQKEDILKLLQKKYSRKDLKNPKERQKTIASLMRKGFELNDITTAINSLPLL